MTKNVLAVFGQSHINFGPLKAVLDAALQRGARVLRCLVGLAAVDHDLERARRLDGFEKRKLRCTSEPGRKYNEREKTEPKLDPPRRGAELRTPETGFWNAHGYWPVGLPGTHQSNPGKRDAS